MSESFVVDKETAIRLGRTIAHWGNLKKKRLPVRLYIESQTALVQIYHEADTRCRLSRGYPEQPLNFTPDDLPVQVVVKPLYFKQSASTRLSFFSKQHPKLSKWFANAKRTDYCIETEVNANFLKKMFKTNVRKSKSQTSGGIQVKISPTLNPNLNQSQIKILQKENENLQRKLHWEKLRVLELHQRILEIESYLDRKENYFEILLDNKATKFGSLSILQSHMMGINPDGTFLDIEVKEGEERLTKENFAEHCKQRSRLYDPATKDSALCALASAQYQIFRQAAHTAEVSVMRDSLGPMSPNTKEIYERELSNFIFRRDSNLLSKRHRLNEKGLRELEAKYKGETIDKK